MSTDILVVDDDPAIRDVLRIALEAGGFGVIEAETGDSALRRVAEGPALVVLDIGLPGKDGLEVCRDIRKSSAVPVLFLTARDDEIDRIVGLELGADDYVTKPFSPREIVARVKAILKRSGHLGVPAEQAQKRGRLTVDVARHRVTVDGETVGVTAREMEMLARLMQRPDHVLSRPALVDSVYGTNVHVSDRTLDSHLRNLRAKLTAAGLPDAIETVHGVGIRMGACRG